MAPEDNRNWQAWLILIPLVLLMATWQAMVRLLSIPWTLAEMLGFLFDSLATAWVVVWLLGHWLSGRHRVAAFLLALAVMLAVGVASYFWHFGTTRTAELLPLLVFYGVYAVTLLLAMTLSGYCCRKQYRPVRFMLWLLLWITVVPAACALAIMIPLAVLEGNLRLLLLTSVLIVPVFFGGALYLMNLPVMILAFSCPFYRDRFRNTFRLQGMRDRTEGPIPPSGD